MTEREKEVEELKEIIFGIILKAPIREIPLEKIAKTIQEKGYTKKHFPVEKLKEWLNGLIRPYEPYCTNQCKDEIFDKIKELEDG